MNVWSHLLPAVGFLVVLLGVWEWPVGAGGGGVKVMDAMVLRVYVVGTVLCLCFSVRVRLFFSPLGSCRG